jgi:hypothetical protein
MLRLAKNSLLLLVVAAGVPSALAFSLAGPLAPWMTQERGYGTGTTPGPMNITEGYRWDLPTITYGFDPAFVSYFGSNGVYAIEQAIKVLNDLPRASDMDLTKFPLSVTRENYRASALRLMDLKSVTLSLMLTELGLDIPELYVWTVRHEYHVPNSNPPIPVYYVIQRNFDPFTYEPSSYINGTLYTYSLFHSDNPHNAFATSSPVDPSLPAAGTVAGFSLVPGQYYTGLTRDDAGGLHYLYHRQRRAVEVLPSDGSITNSGLTFVSGASGGSPWVPITVTNAANTNATGTTTTYIDAALRDGLEKLNFQRVNFDLILGTFITTSNTFVDSFALNGAAQQQSLIRLFSRPDITFTAGDNGVVNDTIVRILYSGTSGWANNSSNNAAINGTVGGVERYGPGNIQPPISFSFSKLGRFFTSVNPTTEAASTPSYVWGSYDGTTNEPVVYPSGTSLRSLELQLFGF